MNIQSYGLTTTGPNRVNNEDIFFLLPKYNFFVLADGMGGHNAGEIAASQAVSYLSSEITNLFLTKLHEWSTIELAEKMRASLYKTNQWVYHLGTKNFPYKGMGTTICSLLFYKNFLIHSHVGDSRIYLFREGNLTQLTKDHCWNTPTNKPSNVLTQAIGVKESINPDIEIKQVSIGDFYLVCSDGLSDVLPDNTIKNILKKSCSLSTTLHCLVQESLRHGGKDDITAIGLQVIE